MQLLDPKYISPLISLLSILLAYFLRTKYESYTQRKAFKLQHACRPPRQFLPKGDPLGLSLKYQIFSAFREHRFLDFVHELFGRKGRTLVDRLWTRTELLCNDPDNVKCVVATKFDDWESGPIRQMIALDFLGKGIFTTDGKFWTHSRAMLRPQFEKQAVADLDQFEEHINNLISAIPADGSTVDLQNLFHRLTMDTSTEFLTGTSTYSLREGQSERARKFGEAMEVASADALTRSFWGSMYHVVPHTKVWRAHRYLKGYVDGYVQRALEHKASLSAEEKEGKSNGKYVFLYELAKKEEVDATRLRDETLNILLAGRDTTASLLSNLWFQLARQKEVWKKLQSEVDELYGELPTYEKLRDMKYLKYCVQETLRLFPPLALSAKIAVRDTVLPHGGGSNGMSPLFIAKGDIFTQDWHSLMRQTSVYGPDAEDFRPDRWADPSLRPGWSYIPFGGGPRVCLGQQYALTEAYITTIRLMQTFRRIESRNPGPWRESVSISVSSFDGVKVGLYK